MVSNIKKFLKNKNMKQILSLALALLPCLALAQYPSNGNQKITLGEQTTADGLFYRGLAADTTRKPSVDTMAYMLLDTATNIMWHYKKATSNAWLRVGGSISSGLTGTLPVANGGTNTSTAFTAGSIVFAGSGGTYNQDNSSLFYDDTNNRLGIGTNSLNYKTEVALSASVYWDGTAFSGGTPSALSINNTTNGGYDPVLLLQQTDGGGTTKLAGGIGLVGTNSWTAGNDASQTSDMYFLVRNNSGGISERMRIKSSGYVGIGTSSPQEKLHVDGNGRITGAYSSTTASAANLFVDSDGDLLRSTSSIKYKSDVEDYAKGLNEVMKLRPVTYKSINSNNDKIYAGFIAEELADLKLTELYENNDNGEPDAISYAYMVTLLTKAIQQQQSQIEDLKKRIINLENK